MTTKNVWIALGLAAVIGLVSCGEEPRKPQTTEASKPAEPYRKVSPAFNADSCYLYVKKQVDFGPRVTNSPEAAKCGDWLVSELKKRGANVIEQRTKRELEGRMLNVRNIIAEFNPKATKRIMLASHWDSRHIADKDTKDQDKPILGANDGASGVGVLLELARLLAANPVNIGIDIVLFDAEDLGTTNNTYCIGSQYWSKNTHKPGYKAEFGILLDMVGAPRATFAWEAFSAEYARPVLEKVWATAGSLGHADRFIYFQYGGIEDDHFYVNRDAGIPMIDIIHYEQNSRSSFPEHHHTHRDNMNVIDRATLKAVGETVAEVVYSENR